MAKKGRPPLIPEEDKPKIIDDILSGRRKKADVARQYGVSQPSIDGLMRRFSEARGLDEEALKAAPKLANQLISSCLEFEENFKKLEEFYGKDVWQYHCTAQTAKKLEVCGYAQSIDLLKNKLSKVLARDTIVEKVGRGDGRQDFEERDIDLQDAKHFKDIASVFASLSQTEGINSKQNQPTVAIQNNQTNSHEVSYEKKEVQLDKLKDKPDFQRFIKSINSE